MIFGANNCSTDELQKLIDASHPVSKCVKDPSDISGCKYIVIVVDPRDPMLREVELSSKDAFETLSDAKDAAREVIKESINLANASLKNLRQIGTEDIGYIEL